MEWLVVGRHVCTGGMSLGVCGHGSGEWWVQSVAGHTQLKGTAVWSAAWKMDADKVISNRFRNRSGHCVEQWLSSKDVGSCGLLIYL